VRSRVVRWLGEGGALLLAVVLAGCATAPAKAPAGKDAVQAPARPQVLLPGAAGDDETKADLPDFPRDADLVELRQGVRPDLRFFVDARSIQVPGTDEVRYTFVVRTASGARNVTFEVARCRSRERITLAVGSANGVWTPARFPRWESVDINDTAGQRGALQRDIICPQRAAPASVKEAVQALRAGMHPRAESPTQ
jgi:hypothetical protein